VPSSIFAPVSSLKIALRPPPRSSVPLKPRRDAEAAPLFTLVVLPSCRRARHDAGIQDTVDGDVRLSESCGAGSCQHGDSDKGFFHYVFPSVVLL
jgi:hypothetical protein